MIDQSFGFIFVTAHASQSQCAARKCFKNAVTHKQQLLHWWTWRSFRWLFGSRIKSRNKILTPFLTWKSRLFCKNVILDMTKTLCRDILTPEHFICIHSSNRNCQNYHSMFWQICWNRLMLCNLFFFVQHWKQVCWKEKIFLPRRGKNIRTWLSIGWVWRWRDFCTNIKRLKFCRKHRNIISFNSMSEGTQF